MRERWRAVEEEREVVDVAIPPVLARLVGLDDRVMHRVEVRGRVPVRRLVAASDVAANHAQAEVHPLTADSQAVLASPAARCDVLDLVEVTTRCHLRPIHLASSRFRGAERGGPPRAPRQSPERTCSLVTSVAPRSAIVPASESDCLRSTYPWCGPC